MNHSEIKLKFKNFFINSALVAFGLFISFIVLEIAIRFSGHEVEKERSKMIYDDRIGHILNEVDWYKKVKRSIGKDRIYFKNKFVNFKKPDGVKRILFLGDSGTFGLNVEYHEAFPELIQQYANENQFKNIEVINTGVPGFTTINEFYFLKNWLLRLKPDVIILGLFMANDINFNLLHYKRDIEKNFWINLTSHLRRYSALLNFIYYKALVATSGRTIEIENQDGLEEWFRPGIKNRHGLHMINYIEGEIALYLKQPEKVTEEAFEVTRDVLNEIKKLTTNLNIDLKIVLIPTLSTLSNKLKMLTDPVVENRLKTFKINHDELDFYKPTNRMKEYAKELNIQLLDPTPFLAPLKENAYAPKDDHLSAKAHRIVADLLIPLLFEKK